MKIHVKILPALCALLAVGAFTPASYAQRAVQSPFSVTVARDKTSSGRQTEYDTGYYSSRNYNRSVALKITVRNMTTNSFDTKLEALFVAEAMSAGSADGIYCKRETSATLTSREVHEFATDSEPLQSHVDKGYYYNYKSGSKFKGYIVRIFANGQLVEVNASQPSLQKIGWDDKTIKKMLGEKEDKPEGGGKNPPGRKTTTSF